jgi:amidase
VPAEETLSSSRPDEPLRAPTADELVELGRGASLKIGLAEARELAPVVATMMREIDGLAALPSLEAPEPVGLEARGGVRRPTPSEDPFNAFIHLCDVHAGVDGPLSGYRVGVKDNTDVAGLPTTNACAAPSYVAEADAAVVERILKAGGRIVGKLNMDGLSAGATGESSAFGPARNPVDPSRIPGGSSSGSGAALAAGQVDLALGGDQAGSARIPASLCGVVALKPTHGLVPSYGMAHLDHTIDSVCPMGRTVDDVGLLLSVVAGSDWRDPQWYREPPTGADTLGDWRAVGLEGMRVGLVEESIDPRVCTPDVVGRTRAAAAALSDAGALIHDVEIPTWRHGLPVVEMLLCHLAGATVASDGEGYGHLGLIDPGRQRAYARTRREHAEDLPAYFKIWILTEAHLRVNERNRTHPLLHNLRLRIRADLDRAFEGVEVLLTPTTPITAPPLLGARATSSELANRVLDRLPYNTSLANLSGHPAVAVPSGTDRDGLPTSAQLLAPRWRDDLALAAARVVEAASR